MTTDRAVDKRHAATESLDRYLESRVPVILPVPGAPAAFIFIEPAKPELGLRVEVDVDADAPTTGLRNIIARIAVRDGKRFLEVVVTESALFHDAYSVLCSMADRVQLNGMSAATALRATLEKMSSLLRIPESMSREREVGLFGELLVVSGLIDVLGAKDAIQAWRGGQAEEHDFGLPEFDAEVKTTTLEHRSHWIESLTQLVPTPQRPLWLVSHQITAAGAGHGLTLPDLVDVVRTMIGSSSALDDFERALAGSGWYESDRGPLTTHWTRRTESSAYLVAGTFPRLTPSTLNRDMVQLDRVPDVRYRVNLDGLTSENDESGILATAIRFEGWK